MMQTAIGSQLGERLAATYGPALWTIAGFVLYVLGGMATLFAIAWIEHMTWGGMGVDTGAGTVGLSVRNGVHALVWGLAAAAAAIPLGRRLVEGLAFGRAGWVVLVVGLLLALLTTMLVNEFVRARYGYYDPEYAGLTVFTGPALVAVALASWATLGVPRPGAAVPALAALTAVAGLAMSLLPSLPGAADGIGASSMPLAAAFAASAAYGVIASVLVVRHLMAERQP